MITDRRTYQLSKDQPILREAGRRRRRETLDREWLEADFWRNFDLEKLGRYTNPAHPIRKVS